MNTNINVNPDKIKPFLIQLIKWLKILLAILMFILGLFNEGIQLNPESTQQELEEANDSVPLSLLGFAATLVCGCPIMLYAGACAGKLFM